jgi:hypothetical protein
MDKALSPKCGGRGATRGIGVFSVAVVDVSSRDPKPRCGVAALRPRPYTGRSRYGTMTRNANVPESLAVRCSHEVPER